LGAVRVLLVEDHEELAEAVAGRLDAGHGGPGIQGRFVPVVRR
jgi:hypothetical protein